MTRIFFATLNESVRFFISLTLYESFLSPLFYKSDEKIVPKLNFYFEKINRTLIMLVLKNKFNESVCSGAQKKKYMRLVVVVVKWSWYLRLQRDLRVRVQTTTFNPGF